MSDAMKDMWKMYVHNAEDDEELRKKREEEERQEREKQRRRRLDLLINMKKKLRKRSSRTLTVNDERWDEIIRVKVLHICFFSMLGLGVSIFQSWYKWERRCYEGSDGLCKYGYTPDSDDELQAATLDNTAGSGVDQILLVVQGIITGTTFVTIYLIGQFYSLKLEERRREWSNITELELMEVEAVEAQKRQLAFVRSYSFWESSLKWQMLAEVIVHLIHPILHLEIAGGNMHTLYEITEVLIFLRLYLLVPLFFLHSTEYIMRGRIIESNKELQRSGYQVNALSTLKVKMYKHPAVIIAGLTFFSVIIFGFAIFVIERNNNTAFVRLQDCCWFVWVTISTIGYGDMSPTSYLGRVTVVVMVVVSLMITTVFSGIVTNLLSPTKEQRHVEEYVNNKGVSIRLKLACAHLLVAVYRRTRERKQAQSRFNPIEVKETGLPRLEFVKGSNDEKFSIDVYHALKEVKRARLEKKTSEGSSGDPVVDVKMQRVRQYADYINQALILQEIRMLELEQMVSKSVREIRRAITKRYATPSRPSNAVAAPVGSSSASPQYLPRPSIDSRTAKRVSFRFEK